MYTNNRDRYRQAFFLAWEKHLRKLALQPLEKQMIEVMLLHPEYHRFLQNNIQNEQQEYAVEENPFMHMSLHLAIRDQISLNKPTGIQLIYQNLLAKSESAHNAEHCLMRALKEALWKSQATGTPMSENDYLYLLRGV